MAPKNPAVLLITKAADVDPAALRSSSADALVVHAADRDLRLDALAEARPDLPIIVLTSADDVRTEELLGAGADEVLPPHASAPEIARAVRQAIARRARRPRAAAAASAGKDVIDPQLQAIARLAAGLGHEFNNLLLIISGNGDMLRDRLPEGTSARDSADAIVDAGRRAAALTRQLLAFGRQQTLAPASLDVNHIVTDAVPAIRNAMGKFIAVTTNLGQNLPQVRVDPDQIRQVLSTLAATALEAMPTGGTFSISTDAILVREDDLRRRSWLRPGPYVRLRLSDTGIGVEEQALPHLFEPFYTPNGTTRGGLTLSSVYGVIKQSGGFIWVDSRVSEGTLVTILLPPIEEPVRAAPPVVSTRVEPAGVRILLVEDIEGVRDVLKSLLEIHRFTVIPMATAEEALDVMRTEPFDILVTDVALPGRSGPDLAREVRKRFPGRPVLFMSGHPMNAMADADLENPRAFLQKPFSGQTLVDRIREMLGHQHLHESAIRNQ
ncbi:MAG TPA: response regulator [Vicinamibacterales bacterium]|nr:response regulator [Vicinamibacterales bacterium]